MRPKKSSWKSSDGEGESAFIGLGLLLLAIIAPIVPALHVAIPEIVRPTMLYCGIAITVLGITLRLLHQPTIARITNNFIIAALVSSIVYSVLTDIVIYADVKMWISIFAILSGGTTWLTLTLHDDTTTVTPLQLRISDSTILVTIALVGLSGLFYYISYFLNYANATAGLIAAALWMFIVPGVLLSMLFAQSQDETTDVTPLLVLMFGYAFVCLSLVLQLLNAVTITLSDTTLQVATLVTNILLILLIFFSSRLHFKTAKPIR